MFYHVHTKAMSTLPQFLFAISHFHAKAHLPSPSLPCGVSRALEGAVHSVNCQFSENFGSHTFSDQVTFVRLRTIWFIFMEYFALLRFNEVAALTFDDLIWTPTGLDLFIK